MSVLLCWGAFAGCGSAAELVPGTLPSSSELAAGAEQSAEPPLGGQLGAQTSPSPGPSPSSVPKVVLAFTGDVNFADDWYNMRHYAKTNKIEDCFSPQLLAQLQGADLLLCNNEFVFSAGGKPMPGKTYTFRADPAHTALWQSMGADLVSLANNHCFDYGKEAFLDTLDTLAGAGLPYVGAGRNLDEAMEARYFEVQGLTIGYVACTRAEKYILTPEAGEESPGVLRCYDPQLTVQAIENARKNCDYLVVYVHWGTERSTQLEEAQTQLATLFEEAGADLIVGAHPHVLQGAGWRGDTPVVYSLGNFWFNMETLDTALLMVTLTGPGGEHATVQLLPCVQTGGKTSLVLDETEKQQALARLNRINESGWWDQDGILHKQKPE